MDIHIVVDSTANVPQEMLAAHSNLHVVPLKIILGEQEWSELELTTKQLFEKVKATGLHPRTSQPSPGDFARILAAVPEGHSIIMLCLSGGLSGTVDGARAVAKDHKGREIYVVDSCTGAIGVIKMAEKALAMAADGVAAKEIAAQLQHMTETTRTLFIVDSLDYLYKGGRIGGAAALFGSILQIKPILTLREGKVQVLDKVRTKPRAIARMLDELSGIDNFEYIGVVDGGEPEIIEEMLCTLRQRYPDVPLAKSLLGSVLGAHLGPKVIGLIFQSRQ